MRNAQKHEAAEDDIDVSASASASPPEPVPSPPEPVPSPPEPGPSPPAAVNDPALLLSYGVCRVPLPSDRIDPAHWAAELSRVTPMNMTAEGDGEYAFYRNILDEPDFPFDAVLSSAIGDAIVRHFGVRDLGGEIRLDDAFCVHYNEEQDDTSGAKHVDPSDITVNMCLEKTADVRGSQVMFYGTKVLEGTEDGKNADSTREADGGSGGGDDAEGAPDGTLASTANLRQVPKSPTSSGGGGETGADFRFLVEQVAGTATVHWGDHPHETLAMEDEGSGRGGGARRTNVVLTYCYTDPSRSDVALRSCYAT